MHPYSMRAAVSAMETDPMKDLPFFAVAVFLHAFLLMENPLLQWGGAAPKPQEKVIPVEFVAAPPAAALLAPGNGDKDLAPGFGPGPLQEEKVERPHKPVLRRGPKKRPSASARKASKPAAASALRKQRASFLQEARAQAAKVIAAERAEAAAIQRQEAARRAEEHRQIALQQAAQKAEKARLQAVAVAVKARRQADVSRELALLASPDERLSDAVAASPASARGRASASASLAAQVDAELAHAEGAAESGRGGADAVSSRPMGGGLGQGGGAAFALDGPIGSRKLLKRVLPSSPDWVSQRGLDLTVSIRFLVQPDGTVKAAAVIKKTSGFPEIDRRALQAIRLWKFQAAPAGSKAEAVWGSVSFRFTMG